MDYLKLLKEEYHTSELKDIYEYIAYLNGQFHGFRSITKDEYISRVSGYACILQEKLTPELVEKLFKRVEKQPRNTMTKYILGVNGFADGDGFILGFDGKKWFTNSCSHIETLADLARLTAAKPILLS